MITYESIPILEKAGPVVSFYTTGLSRRFGCNEEADEAEYRELGETFQVDPSRMVRIPQTHTANVCVITAHHAGEGIIRNAGTGYDGMITDEAGLMILTVQADCVPVYLFDPVRKVIGMVHSGWKGCAGGIASNAVRQMKKAYGSDPLDVLAAFGPCICRDCYEVGAEVREAFLETYRGKLPDKCFVPHGTGKYLLDLTATIRSSLGDAGVRADHIFESPACTLETKDLCSYRRDHDRARMLTGIMLTK